MNPSWLAFGAVAAFAVAVQGCGGNGNGKGDPGAPADPGPDIPADALPDAPVDAAADLPADAPEDGTVEPPGDAPADLSADLPTPPAGCCWQDADCPDGQTCAVSPTSPAPGWGVCLPVTPGRCWDDPDCAPGWECHGAGFCPCQVDCDLLWAGPGICVETAARCKAVSPSLIEEICDAAGLVVFDGTKCVGTCPGCCGCQGFCDLAFQTLEACQAACTDCTAHSDCPAGQVCLGPQAAPSRECGLCGTQEACRCAVPDWSEAQRRCTVDADCAAHMPCGAGCDDCPPCPHCVNGWCAWEVLENVECICTGCA